MMLFPNFRDKVRGIGNWTNEGERNGRGENARVNGYFNAFKIFNAIHEMTLSQNRAVIFACPYIFGFLPGTYFPVKNTIYK